MKEDWMFNTLPCGSVPSTDTIWRLGKGFIQLHHTCLLERNHEGIHRCPHGEWSPKEVQNYFEPRLCDNSSCRKILHAGVEFDITFELKYGFHNGSSTFMLRFCSKKCALERDLHKEIELV